MRGSVVAVVIGLVLVGAVGASAQTRDPGAVRQRGRDRGDRDRPYFQPNVQPYQGSYPRRMRQQFERMWGDVPARRGVPPRDRGPLFLPPPRDTIFVHPPAWGRVHWPGRRGCHRLWGLQGGYRGDGWSWQDWYGPTY
ncbi:MAG: hypothetical protein AB7Y46_19525 [Armatimonadota bacterium]